MRPIASPSSEGPRVGATSDVCATAVLPRGRLDRIRVTPCRARGAAGNQDSSTGRMTKIGPLPSPSDGVPKWRISSRTTRPRRGSRSSNSSAVPRNDRPPATTSTAGSSRRLRAQSLSGPPAATRIDPSGSATNPTVTDRHSPLRRPRVLRRANRSSSARASSTLAWRWVSAAGSAWAPGMSALASGFASGSSAAVSDPAARTCPRSRRTGRRPSRRAACRRSSVRRGRPSTGATRRRGSPSHR